MSGINKDIKDGLKFSFSKGLDSETPYGVNYSDMCNQYLKNTALLGNEWDGTAPGDTIQISGECSLSQGNAAKEKAEKSADKAKTSASGAKESAAKAKENYTALNEQDNDVNTQTTQALTQLSANQKEIDQLQTEDDKLVAETKDTYERIEELYKEDGDDSFVAPEVVAPTVNTTGNNSSSQASTNNSQSSGNFFTSGNTPSFVATSETAIAAANSEASKQNQPSSAPTNSLNIFGNTLAKPNSKNGKNAAEIASLEAKANKNQSTLSKNGFKLNNTFNKSLGIMDKQTRFFSSSINTTNEIKQTSEDGKSAAETTIDIGNYTQTAGQITQKIGIALQSNMYTQSAGVTIERSGKVVEGVGIVTTGAGELSRGNNLAAIDKAGQSVELINNSKSKIQQAKPKTNNV